MNIYIFDIENWERKAFARLEHDHQVRYVPESLTSENASQFKDADIISIFLSPVEQATIEALPHLKMIAVRCTGFDFIDARPCGQRGIAICNVPTYGANTVAEHAFALLLTISHRVEEAIDRTRKGDFGSRGLQGFDLMGKTIGVIGTGSIGTHAIRIANGFGMNVLAFDVRPNEEAAKALGFRYVGMDELLRESDIITLTVPLLPSTYHLLAKSQFDQMKDGVVLINIARGDLIDEEALVRAIAEKKVAAAGLDVLAREPVIREEAELLRSVYEQNNDLQDILGDELLTRMRNVIVTPHSGFNTKEAVARIIETTVENIEAFARGERHNVVSVSVAPKAA
jgi:D-lactate dehydrogenase